MYCQGLIDANIYDMLALMISKMIMVQQDSIRKVMHRVMLIRKLYVFRSRVNLLCNEPMYCSASYMFVTRGLPTCNMLIIKQLYTFMSIANSGNKILQSILNSDALYTSQMYQHWRSVLYIIIFYSNIYYYFGKCAITG